MSEQIVEIVTRVLSEAGVSDLLIAVFGAILTYIFGRIGKNVLTDQKKKTAIEIITAAVGALGEVAKTYKQTNSDNKLQPTQKIQLAQTAISNAQQIGNRVGLDILGTLGPELAELAVTEAVKRLKSADINRKANTLPQAVKNLLP